MADSDLYDIFGSDGKEMQKQFKALESALDDLNKLLKKQRGSRSLRGTSAGRQLNQLQGSLVGVLKQSLPMLLEDWLGDATAQQRPATRDTWSTFPINMGGVSKGQLWSDIATQVARAMRRNF